MGESSVKPQMKEKTRVMERDNRPTQKKNVGRKIPSATNVENRTT